MRHLRYLGRWVWRAEPGPHDTVQGFPLPILTFGQYLARDERFRRAAMVNTAVMLGIDTLLALVLGYAALVFLDAGPLVRVAVLLFSVMFLVGALDSQANLRAMWRHRDDPLR